MTITLRTSILAALALAACGDDLLAPPPPPPPPGARTISGKATLVLTDEHDHATTFPIGLHDTLVSAQFPAGDGWDVREGTSDADGTFTIEGAADGAYWLEVEDVQTGQRQLLWTDATTLAFEERGNGRGDAVTAGPGTTLTFALDGLDPVQDLDGLELASGNLGLIANLPGVLTPGTTTLHTTRQWTGNPLISAAAHDSVILAQLRTDTDANSGLTITHVVTAATLDTIEARDRQDTQVTGSFTTPPALAYDLAWKRSAFAAAAADIHPTRVGPVAGVNVTVRAMPGGVANGTSPLAPTVLSIDDPIPGDGDLDLPFALRNPFPRSWLFGDYQIGFPIVIPTPDDPGQALAIGTGMEVITDQLPDSAHPIVPLVTPPRTPSIDGKTLFADHDGMGLTPTISWSAPAQGTPTAYVITVLSWQLQFNNSGLLPVATLIVPGDVTSVRMPDRVLVPGERYLLRLAAISQAGQDVRTHSLYTLGTPYGYAELWGNTFSP